MEVFLQAVMPLMILIFLGYNAGRLFKGDGKLLSNITLWIFANILTFSFINDHPPTPTSFAVYGGAFLFIFLYNFLLFKLFLRKRRYSDVYFLTSIFGNTGYLGYPVLGLAFGSEAIAYGVIYSVVSVVFVNTFGVAMLMNDLKESLKKLVKLPFIYSVIAGLILGYAGINWHDFPVTIRKAMEMLNDAAIPIITVFLGSSMSKVSIKKEALKVILLSSLHRLIAVPAIAVLIAMLFKMEGLFKIVFIVESAMPTAMNATVISSAIDKDPEIISSEIALSTILSAFTLTLWINVLK